MPKKTQKRAPKRARAAAKPAKSKNSAKAPVAATKQPSAAPAAGTDPAAAAQRFVSDLLIRGEAETRNKKGTLPQHATHAIKKQNPDGSVEVERVRFKTF